MQFKAYIKNGAKEFEVEFEIDDETAGYTRLTEALAKIQKIGKKPERAAPKPADAPRTLAPSVTATAGAK